ncbi:hypothetical protein RCL_jg7984.t1 [Rhizophagus clarus]|uniref:Uncharacterized protein n=1 Tax=Rhizophagus clarus TaxID=94130 RepID=A0A8H3R9E8_9GLOM|nr:hypothetical protein RCL_jg7984.t1 [Rhizophagus clarus]
MGETQIKETISIIGLVNKLTIKRQHKYKSVKASIQLLKSNFHRLLEAKDAPSSCIRIQLTNGNDEDDKMDKLILEGNKWIKECDMAFSKQDKWKNTDLIVKMVIKEVRKFKDNIESSIQDTTQETRR